MSIPLYFTFSAEEAAAAVPAGHPAACLGYHLAEDAPALLAPQQEPDFQCRMVLDDSVLPQYPPTEALARMTAQYAAARHSGLICDFDRPPVPFWQDFLPLLETACGEVGLSMWVPEAYGDCVSKSPVMIPSDRMDGTFRQSLDRAAARWPQGCVLKLRPLSCLIALPGPAEPKQLPRSAVDCQMDQCITGGFSETLYCRWGLVSDDPVTVLLWDDQSSLEQKLNLAQEAGFQAAVGLWQELNFPAET